MTPDEISVSPFNRSLLSLRRRRALKTAAKGSDFLLRLAAEDLEERLAALSRRFPLALSIGDAGGHLAAALHASGKIDHLVTARLAGMAADPSDGRDATAEIDDEFLPFADHSLDLIVSTLSLQWANDLPGALIQARRALKPDGLFLGSMVGGDTLHELRDVLLGSEAELTGGASPRVSPFADTREIGGLLQRAGFALPVTDQDRYTVRYDTIFDLMRDLRAMGATSILVQGLRPLSRTVVLRAAELYAERHRDADGRIRATFQIVSMSGWAPHESQQKPLRPGSARTRLADALGTTEIATGDTAGKPAGERD